PPRAKPALFSREPMKAPLPPIDPPEPLPVPAAGGPEPLPAMPTLAAPTDLPSLPTAIVAPYAERPRANTPPERQLPATVVANQGQAQAMQPVSPPTREMAAAPQPAEPAGPLAASATQMLTPAPAAFERSPSTQPGAVYDQPRTRPWWYVGAAGLL